MAPLPDEVKAHVLKVEKMIRSPIPYPPALIAFDLETASGVAHLAGDEELQAEILEISRAIRGGGELGLKVVDLIKRAHE